MACERSFSKLKLVKTFKVQQRIENENRERLNSFIERDEGEEVEAALLDYSEMIT